MSERLPVTWTQLLLLLAMYFATGALLAWHWNPRLRDLVDKEIESESGLFPDGVSEETLRVASFIMLTAAAVTWPVILTWRTYSAVDRKLFPRVDDEDEDEDGDSQ